MEITSKAIAEIINKDPGYIRVLLKRRGITLRFPRGERARLSSNYISNIKKLIVLINEYTLNDNNNTLLSSHNKHP